MYSMKIILVHFSTAIFLAVFLKEISGKHHKHNQNRVVQCPQIKCTQMEPDPKNPPCQRCVKNAISISDDSAVDDFIACPAIVCPHVAISRNKFGCPICGPGPVNCLDVVVKCDVCETMEYNPCPYCKPIKDCHRPICKLVNCPVKSLHYIDPNTGCPRCEPVKPIRCPLITCTDPDAVIDPITGCPTCHQLLQ